MKLKSVKVNASLSAIKQCLSIVLPLITTPYITRTIGVENYGKINFGNSVISYFTLVADFGISTYAVLEGSKLRKTENELNQFSNEVFSVNIITTLFAYLLLVLTTVLIPQVRGYGVLLLIQALPIIFTALGTDWFNTISEDFLYTTVRYIIIQCLSLVMLLVFVKGEKDYLLYALIVSGSSICGKIINLLYIRRKYIKIKFTYKMKFYKHLRPMIVLFANSLAISIYVNADLTMLTIFKGNVATGIYSISVKIYTIIKQVLAAVISVLVPRISFYIGEQMMEEYARLLTKAVHALFLMILPATIGVFVFAESIVYIIGGRDYVLGAGSLRILSLAIFAGLLSSLIISTVLLPNKEEKYVLKTTFFAAIFNVFANLILIPLYSYLGAASTTLLAEFIVLVLSYKKSVDIFKLKINFTDFRPCLFSSGLVFMICIICNYFFTNVFIKLIVAILLSGLAYSLNLIFMKDKIIYDLFNKLLVKEKV